MKKVFLALLLLSAIFLVEAQTTTSKDSLQQMRKNRIRHTNLSLKYQAGTVMQTNGFLKGENASGTPIDYYQSLAIQYGKQTNGDRDWEHIFNFPHYGIGFYTANFFNSDELGYPNALYGFIGMPLRRYEKGELGYKLGFGLTYNWKPYDGYDNPWQVAIGSYRTVYIDANVYYNYYLGKRWDLFGGFGFTHFSNGGTRKPNFGINLLSPYVELRYSFKDRPTLIRKVIEPKTKHQEIALQFAATGRQIDKNDNIPGSDEEIVYTVLNFSTAWLRQPSHRNKYGAGFDVTYDQSIKTQLERAGDQAAADKGINSMTLGIFGTYEFTIDRLSIASYLGAYALRKNYESKPPLLYQKFGLKYHFANDMYAGLLVRAHNFGVADFIEWNIGYRIKWYE